VEPHRVHCSRCDKWLSLGTKQTYALGPWDKHRESCDRKPSQALAPEDDDDASVAFSIAQSEQEMPRTEAERQAFLEADPRAEQVLPNEALCKKCQKWIKLAFKQRYALGNWLLHQHRCSGSIPSSRVATAERKLKIVNDAQAKSFTARSVECASCGTITGLEGDYVLTKWEEHKSRCSGNPSATDPNRPPLSSTSDDTLVAPSANPALARGTKRSRDADDDDVPEPVATRAKTGDHVQSNNEPLTALEWILLPFQTFVSGFRQGLKG